MNPIEVNVEKFNDKIYICADDLISLFEKSILPENTATFNSALRHFAEEIKEIAKESNVNLTSP